jgi:integrase
LKTIAVVLDAHAAGYAGRDPAHLSRCTWWVTTIGPDTLVSEITPEILDDALAALMARGALRYTKGKGLVPTGKPLSGASINRHLASLGTLFKFAKKQRLLPRSWVSPLKSIDKEPESEGRFDCYSADEIERLIKAARVGRWTKLPALITMAFQTGLRRGALQGLRWRDIDLKSGTASVGRTKNGRPIVATLTARVIEELNSLPGHRDADEFVFGDRDFRKAWSTAIEVAGLRPLPFHCLRHSCASHLAGRGASSVMLAEVLGHRSLRMVSRYAHLNVEARARFVDEAFAA